MCYGALAFPYGGSSNTKEFRTIFFYKEYTFWEFLIDLLSVLNELRWFSVGAHGYAIFIVLVNNKRNMDTFRIVSDDSVAVFWDMAQVKHFLQSWTLQLASKLILIYGYCVVCVQLIQSFQKGLRVPSV